MLQFVCGGAGVGKSLCLYQNIAKDLKSGNPVLLIVPEHQVLESEKAVLAVCHDAPTLQLEVLSFSRLAQRVFRTLGGMTHRDLERGAQLLVMWRTLRELAPLLQEFTAPSLREQGFLERTLDTVSEFQNSCVTAEMLTKLVPRLENDALRKKIADFAQIYSAYEAILTQEYDYAGNALQRAVELLCENAVFENFCIYIDSFVGFTVLEYRLIKELMRHGKKMTVALPLLQNEVFFLQESALTRTHLEKIASKMNCPLAQTIFLSANSTQNSALAYLAEHLWDMDRSAQAFDKDTVPQLYYASGIFEEVEFIAQKICEEVRNGSSYREIVIISRNLTRYEGILESVFQTYQIPFFLSKQIELQKKPFIRWVQNLLTVIANNFRVQDMMSYLRTSYLQLSPEEYNLLERYVTTWNIQGERWLQTEPWCMNPNGYTDTTNEQTQAKLERINALRDRIVAPMRPLYDCLLQRCQVKTAVQTLYQIAQNLEIPSQLQAENAIESNLIWNTWIDALDQLYRVCGEMEMEHPRQFLQMLNLILSQAHLRDIPSYADGVLVADAAEIQASNIKTVYLVGVVADQFPAVMHSASLFSVWERKDMLQSGLELIQSDDLDIARELYYAYRAVSIPQNKLVLSAYRSNSSVPSELFDRVAQIFSLEPVEIDALTSDLQIQKKEPAWQYYCANRHTLSGQALEKIFAQDEAYLTKLEQFKQFQNQTQVNLTEQTTKMLYPADLALTQTRMERFVKCPFAYHCQYTLHLEAAPTGQFKPTDSGTLLHRILELVVQHIQETTGFSANIDDKTVEDLVETEINRYLIACCGNRDSASLRLQNLFRRLQKTAVLLVKDLVKEFSQSLFYPAFFELPMQTKEQDDGAKTLEIDLDDGSKVQIYGYIDRVDLYQKDDTVYIRVVDYKSGTTEHRLDDVRYGLNLQMLLYLFALWKNPPKVLKDRVNATESTDFLPAGVLYFSANTPKIISKVGFLSPEVYENTLKIPRTGMLLDNEDVLHAMEKELEGKFIPITSKTKKGTNSLQDLEHFGQLYQQVCHTVSRIATELKNGVASPTPEFIKNNCSYCSYQDICRKAKKKKY